MAFWIQDIFPPAFFTSFNFLLMFLVFQAKIHSGRFEILQRFCLWVWVYCKMNHLIYALMQISSPGYYLTWIFPSGKNCHAVEFPGFKCESAYYLIHLIWKIALGHRAPSPGFFLGVYQNTQGKKNSKSRKKDQKLKDFLPENSRNQKF